MLNGNTTSAGMNAMRSVNIKEAAHQLIEQLDHPTWAELAYQVAMKASIEQGLEEANAGQLISQQDIEKEFGIKQ